MFLKILEQHLGLIVTVVAFLFAWICYIKERKAKIVQKLARQVIAYYSLEDSAVKWIAVLTGKNEQTVQRELRERSMQNVNNLEAVRPEMTATEARKLIEP